MDLKRNPQQSKHWKVKPVHASTTRQKSRIKNLPLYDKNQTRVYIRAFHMDPAACMYLLCVFQVENVEAWLLNTMESKAFENRILCPIYLVTFRRQFRRQIIFKREKERLFFSLLNIICCQIWYQHKSDYMDRALGWISCHLMGVAPTYFKLLDFFNYHPLHFFFLFLTLK